MAQIDKRMASMGISYDHLDHSNPVGPSLSKLIPATIPGKMSAESIPPISSFEVLQNFGKTGIRHTELPLPIYRSGSLGQPRKLDNSDAIKGKELLYTDLEHLKSVISKLTPLVTEMLSFYKADKRLIGSMELEDLEKITIQQWKYVGWFLEPPIAIDQKQSVPKEFITAVDVLFSKLSRAPFLHGRYPTREQEKLLMLADEDPSDSMIGMPTLASGDNSVIAKMATLSAMPDPTGFSPGKYLDALDALGASLGLPERCFYSTTVSTRYGPLRATKPVRAWTAGPGGYHASYDLYGVMNRVRQVFPASAPMNVLTSPLYMQIVNSFKHTLGLYHDTPSKDKYIEAMKRTGKYSYTSDASHLDQSMSVMALKVILNIASRYGFSPWTNTLFADLMDRLYYLFPSYGADGSSVTAFYGEKGYASGWKNTNVLDTLLMSSVHLMAMEQLQPGYQTLWLSDKRVFADSGDDLIFTLDEKIDPDKYASIIYEAMGITIKPQEDAIFLKMFLPIHPDVPKLSRPIARVIQQTFFNEDRYTGIENGDKPPCIMRLGLVARLLYIDAHPDFAKWWPPLWSVISELQYVRDSDPAWKADMAKGVFHLQDGDMQAITDYGMKQPSYFQKLFARAKYEPSAKIVIDLLVKSGVKVSEEVQSQQARNVMIASLYKRPDAAAVTHLRSQMTWLRQF